MKRLLKMYLLKCQPLSAIKRRIFNLQLPAKETLMVGLLLALAGGGLDAYSFILCGGVFANAQTGNIALLGVCLSNQNWGGAIAFLLPIAAYFVGVLFSERIKSATLKNEFLHWEYVILICECSILFVLGFVPRSMPRMLCTVPISFVCSLQTHSFRKLHGAVYATTMCTGNLRSAAESFYLWTFCRDKQAKARCGRYLIVVLSFAAGALIETVFANFFGQYGIWFCVAILMLAFSISIARDNIVVH